MPHPSDPGIPTLTQRAEPTLSPSAGAPDAPVLTEVAQGGARAYADDAFPVLTDVAESADSNDWPADDFPVLTDTAESDDFPLLTEAADLPAAPEAAPALPAASQPAAQVAPTPSEAGVPPQAAVLAARLQAEVEQAMRLALADAIEQIQARMDEELPRIVARVLQDVRPG
ncbi:hypothetical protein [Achromobacter sp. DH1f]|uniref:hypothetical protein n=1 Tax=Achromobacter sp. DH1f TaxID=1397275 RepID=UPI00046828EA|nr:hypothetical protein [Achromobacter sp. DH1f]